MRILEVSASRNNGVVDITITGQLPNTCTTAEIVDKYPGGHIAYIQDPGYAKVFIEETVESEICNKMKGPDWTGKAKIPDSQHGEVTIFVNDEPVTKAQIQ